MKKIVFIAALCFLAVTATNAQSKWKYQLGFGGTINSGNVNSVTINNDGSISRNDSVVSFGGDYQIVYGQKDHVDYDRGLSASLKMDLFQYDRWSPFISASYLNNKFKGFEYKLSFLAGVKYLIYVKPNVCNYSVSAAFVYDYVDYGLLEDDSPLHPQVARISLRFKAKQKISDAVSINHTTFYQPSVTDFGGDFLFNTITKLETQLSTHMFFDISFSYEYRSLVPEDIKHYDIVTSAALRLKF